MASVVIIAGGTGRRMNNSSIPKQFLEVLGKPIIVHTLEHFENHSEIENICVVCRKGWIEFFEKLVDKFSIKKISTIVEGGETGQESIYLGLQSLALDLKVHDDEIVLIHDSVRPVIDAALISSNIEAIRESGASVSVCNFSETVLSIDESKMVKDVGDREIFRIARAPQGAFFKNIYSMHLQAISEQKNNFTDTLSLMNFYGQPFKTVACSFNNIKITTAIDVYVFKALLEVRENAKYFGVENYAS